jgi:two-component system, chemotaxis family, sensor kinase CheA
MDDQLLSEFLAEAEEMIEGLHADLASLRARRGEGRARRELVGRIFRQVHTVKGTASSAGLEAASRLAHEFESLLDAMRMGRVAVDDASLEASEEAVGALAACLEAVARGVNLAVPQRLVERMRSLASAGASAEDSGGLRGDADDDGGADEFARLPREVVRALGEYERQRLREAAREGARAYVVSADFGLDDFDEQFRRLSSALAACGEVVSTQPFVNASAPERVGFRIVCATARTRAELAALAAAFGASLPDEDDAPPDEDSAPHAEEASSEGAGAEAADASPLPTPVRVSLEELDDIIWTAHGLFAEVSHALELDSSSSDPDLGASPRDHDDASAGDARREESGDGGARREAEERGREESVERRREESEARAADIRRRLAGLEERLTALRMVPLRATLERAARAGRAAARAAGKPVEFETAGGEVRLDRSLADRVAEPLLHLLRNAVDHGVEGEEERRAAGKGSRGRVRVEAAAEGGRVLLRVSDDGRGVDAELVARAAVERGLVAAGARVTEEQALRLIFRPGFSTATRASLVSGRGVGLEVVERAVEEAGGEVRVRTRRGRGTTFELRLPTTLALLPTLVVRSSGYFYCVDSARVVAAGRAGASDITRDGARKTLRWRGRELPLVRLRELLGQAADEEAARAAVDSSGRAVDESSKHAADGDGAGGDDGFAFFVARAGGRRGEDDGEEAAREGDERGREEGEGAREDVTGQLAVVVDGVEGETQALVRGLGRHATRWRGVGGATELEDGTVALVLDLPRLLEAAGAGKQ